MRSLPTSFPEFEFPFYFRGNTYDITVKPARMVVSLEVGDLTVDLPFSIDEERGRVVFTNARVLQGRCGEDVEAEEVVEALQHAVTGHFFCPHCGHCADQAPHFEDNGRSSSSSSHGLLCLACSHQWSPNGF